MRIAASERLRVFWLLSIFLTSVGLPVTAQEAAADKTLAPYFFVRSDDSKVDRLPLKRTDVDVQIAGVIAQVKVVQRYRNEGVRPLEAQYVFPGSTRAAVYALTMTIGERRVTAEIRRKEQARVEYQTAKAQGKSAALLEQHRPNVFTMNVANIMPGDDVAVELSYTELLVANDHVYEFVFPAVVGPRYSTTPANAQPAIAHWQANPYLHQGEEPSSDFNIQIALNSGIPIKDVGSASHQVQVQYRNATNANVALTRDERRANNRDFIMTYRLAGDAVESGLLIYEGQDKNKGENFFAALIEPPRRVTSAEIPPRDYVFVVDVSGSMHGFPLATAKSLLRELVGHLRPTDTFNVLLFAGSSTTLSDRPIEANENNIKRALAFIDAPQGGGGTELLPALRRALALPGGTHDERGRSRSIVVVTDGYVDVEAETFELIRDNLDKANVFAFGIGSSVNRHLIEGMARVGRGEPTVITNSGEAFTGAERFRKYIESPVLTHVTLQSENFDIYDVEPAAIADVLADRPIVVFGKWRGPKRGRLVLRGISGSGPYEKIFELKEARADANNSALRYLWARDRIAQLGDFEKLAPDSERAEQITQLGLQYSLLTKYTSFIAVDHLPRNPSPADSDTVKQPLPLPQGVSDLAVGGAVGGEIPTSPEPELFVLLGVAGAMAEWQRRRARRAANKHAKAS